MSPAVKAIPEGFRTLTPGLVVNDGHRAIDFYKKAFGAEEVVRMDAPGGKGVMHAELKFGDSRLFLSDEMPGMSHSPHSLKGTTQAVYMYVQDVDAVFNRAVAAGAKVIQPLSDMFWGDRFGKVADPFGHEWGLATHKEDVPPAEMDKRSKAFMEQMAKQRGKQ
jgi:PhnB protein